MNLTKAEEDYLKALYNIQEQSDTGKVGVNQLAEYLSVSPASVNSMVKKLKSKELLDNKKYSKLALADTGHRIAINLIRKHRLWETFLYQYLNFKWDEVHEVAEQLEHIQSPKLIDELDRFMSYPGLDPHGDPIPTAAGHVATVNKLKLSDIETGSRCKIINVKDSSVKFLQYISELGLVLSSELLIEQKNEYDNSMSIRFDNQTTTLSHKVTENIYVQIL